MASLLQPFCISPKHFSLVRFEVLYLLRGQSSDWHLNGVMLMFKIIELSLVMCVISCSLFVLQIFLLCVGKPALFCAINHCSITWSELVKSHFFTLWFRVRLFCSAGKISCLLCCEFETTDAVHFFKNLTEVLFYLYSQLVIETVLHWGK